MDSRSSVFQVRVRGDLACFTRPEFGVERVSYDLITPSAARAVLEAILWKPAIQWHITRIWLLSPVKFIQLRRNEVNKRAATGTINSSRESGEALNYFADEDRAQRNTIALRDVDYAVEAHFVLTSRKGPGDNILKFEEMFTRRLVNGQHHYQPYLGCREFPAKVEPYQNQPTPCGESRPLGMMLHDIAYGRFENRAVFFPAILRNGELQVPAWTEGQMNNKSGEVQ